MPGYICTTCGNQYPNTEEPPAGCLICLDTRQYVNPSGQGWTTMQAMRKTHFNAFRRLEQGLMGIGTFPSFAIGQRALLLRTPAGNVLWDCISFLDDATVTIIQALGGLAAIACSHPHFIASAVEWSHAFKSVPVYIHARDRKYVPRHDAVIQFWVEDQVLLAEGLTMIRCGGHFPGSSVLHWAAGAGGAGVAVDRRHAAGAAGQEADFHAQLPEPDPAGCRQRAADCRQAGADGRTTRSTAAGGSG